MNNTSQVAFGQLGSKLTTTAAVSAPSGKSIVAITVLATGQTVTASSEDTNLCPDLAVPIAAGTTVYGRYSDIKTTAANGATAANAIPTKC